MKQSEANFSNFDNKAGNAGKLIFPSGFLWGASTSSHQVEGGNTNDWSEWEKANAQRLAEEAKNKWQPWQKEKFPAMFEPQNYISGRACDHYNRYEQDFDIAKSLGHNAHRLAIEWSRIEPEEGKFDQAAIEHYREVIKSLRERGMEPFVTLWHWTLPLWVRDMGGWENKKTIGYFARYADKIAEALGSEVKFWIPINEPTVYVGMSYIVGAFPPQVKKYLLGNKVLKNLIEGHRHVYKLIHKRFGRGAMVGSSHNLHFHTPYRKGHIADIMLTELLNYIIDARSLKWSRGHQDFIGLNYYYRDTVKFVFGGRYLGLIDIKNPNEEISDLGWDIYPEGIYHILKKIKKYNLPIYITENGLADASDIKRKDFIKRHLAQTHKAIDEGVDVRGYFHWSLLDNFEWDKGFWPRFGLVEVDYKTLERQIRPSALEYAKICRNNSLEINS